MDDLIDFGIDRLLLLFELPHLLGVLDFQRFQGVGIRGRINVGLCGDEVRVRNAVCVFVGVRYATELGHYICIRLNRGGIVLCHLIVW